MITAKQLRALMHANPFKPFRVHLSDGSHHDVLNHDAAFVEAGTLDIGVDLNAEGFAQDIIRCSILHITRIQDLPARKLRKAA